MCVVMCSANDFKVGDLYYRIILNDEEVMVVSDQGTGASYSHYVGKTHLIIPATITYQGITYKVTQIDDRAFYNCPDLETIEIGVNIKKIGRTSSSYVFGSSPKLNHVIWRAEQCNGWDYYYSPFYRSGSGGSTQITTIEFTDDVKVIPAYLCIYMSNLETVKIGKNVVSIGTSNSQYFKNIYIKDLAAYCNISISGNFPTHRLYLNDVEVSSLVIPNSVNTIQDNTFNGCSSLTSLTIHEAVDSIAASAFCNCPNLKNVAFNAVQCADPNNVIFDGQIDNVTFGENVKHIPSYLCKSTSISQLTIPENIESIGQYAIAHCSNLQNVIWRAKDCSFVEGSSIQDAVANYREGYITYINSVNIQNVSFGSHVQKIPSCLCADLYDLQEIIIPDSVISIGSHAFERCINLSSLTLGSGIKEIGSYAFNECESIDSVILPIGLHTIGVAAFRDCSLNSITIPNNVTNIGGRAFAGCTGLTQVTIEEGVQGLSKEMFVSCTNLTNLSLPSSLKELGEGVFWGCTALRVILPDSLIHIGANAIYNTFTYNLDRNWENGVLYVGNYLIQGLQSKGLRASYNIKNDTKVIADGAFQGASNVTTITIPESITHIGNGAFQGASNLTTVTIPENVEYIGDRAFYNCSKMTSAINLPSRLEYIGDSAMYFKTNYIWSYTLYLPRTLAHIGVAAFWSDYNNKASINAIYSYPSTPLQIGDEYFKLKNSQANTPVYVYADDANKYFSADVWKQFDIQIISAPSVTITDSIGIDITRTEATFKWQKIAQAKTYILVVQNQNGDTVEIVAINDQGEVKYDDRRLVKRSTVSSNGFQYTISNLENNTNYTYVLQAKNASGNIIKEYTDSFVTGIRYSVRFVDWDDALLKEEIVRESESATPPENPSREGYTFIGWDKEYTNINRDLTIKALYDRDVIYYTVTFLDWDGEELFVDQVEEGKNAEFPLELLVREGYTFIGWSKSITNIQGNIIVVAQYELIDGIEDISDTTISKSLKKLLHNGHLLIQCGNQLFNAQGARVR